MAASSQQTRAVTAEEPAPLAVTTEEPAPLAEEPAPLAVSNVVFDQIKPGRLGNSVFGMLSGTFVDPAPTYANTLAAIAGRFLTQPPPRVTYVATGVTNQYAFIAMGRCV